MHKLTFTLKQHTPIIHFQSEQEGATLRATEFKAKLDFHLYNQVYQNNVQLAKPYMIGCIGLDDVKMKKRESEGIIAFDYSVKIISNQNQKPEDIEDFPCYFGNLGNSESHPKKFIHSNALIEVIILSKYSDLLDHIKKQICQFMAWNNFGMRQSKGFGSFYLDCKDLLYEEPNLTTYFNSSLNNNEQSISKRHMRLFKDIELVVKALRSGINEKYRNGIYMKPLIWQFFKDKGISWEKRFIKEKFYLKKLKNQISIHSSTFTVEDSPVSFSSTEYKIVKDFLGLSTYEEAWESEYGYKISKKSESIARYQSPIVFKPIQTDNEKYKIYMHYYETHPEMKDHSFEIKATSKSGDRSKFLSTASSFDIDEFFDFILDKDLDLEGMAHVYRDNRSLIKLVRIFNELRINQNGK